MYRQKRYKECIKEVKSKLKLAPKSLHLLNYHAMACSGLKRDEEALLSYQKIKKLDPTLAGPYYNMGIIFKISFCKNFNKVLISFFIIAMIEK